jgi:hypothetical protein
MAKTQVVSYSFTCDVCGNSIAETDGDATRKLSWEGADYAIDVCSTHGPQLADILTELKAFVDAGHRAGARRGRRPAVAAASGSTSGPRTRRASSSSAPAAAAGARGDVKAVRAWAQTNGHKVGDRGRIPAEVFAAYDSAQPSSSSSSLEAAPVTSDAAPEVKKAVRRPRKAAAANKSAATPRKRAPRKAAASV